jgi:hypothetical protein
MEVLISSVPAATVCTFADTCSAVVDAVDAPAVTASVEAAT